MVSENNIDVLFHSQVIASEVEDRKIVKITVASVEGLLKFEAPYFIDATGDAALVFASKIEYDTGREEDFACQPMTLCFNVGNVDFKGMAYYEIRKEVNGPLCAMATGGEN